MSLDVIDPEPERPKSPAEEYRALALWAFVWLPNDYHRTFFERLDRIDAMKRAGDSHPRPEEADRLRSPYEPTQDTRTSSVEQ